MNVLPGLGINYGEGMHLHNFSPLLQRETTFITPCLPPLTKKPLQKRSFQKKKEEALSHRIATSILFYLNRRLEVK